MTTDESLKSLLPKFIKSLEDKKRSPSTILAYRADLEQMINYFALKNIVLASQSTEVDIESFKTDLLNKKYTPKSVSRKLNAVKTFFRWLVSEDKITKDVSKNVPHPEINASKPKFLTPIEYRALRDTVRTDERIATIVEIILQTGMRISEVAGLKIKNIQENKITIESYATQPQRTIPLNNPAKSSIQNYLRLRPKSSSEYLFVSKNGKPLAVRNIRAAIDRYMQRADVSGYSVNDLRTTFLIENLKNGVDLVLLSQVAGHRRLSTTERYLELAEIKTPGKKQALEEL
jgi:site-specific recombinase XerD